MNIRNYETITRPSPLVTTLYDIPPSTTIQPKSTFLPPPTQLTSSPGSLSPSSSLSPIKTWHSPSSSSGGGSSSINMQQPTTVTSGHVVMGTIQGSGKGAEDWLRVVKRTAIKSGNLGTNYLSPSSSITTTTPSLEKDMVYNYPQNIPVDVTGGTGIPHWVQQQQQQQQRQSNGNHLPTSSSSLLPPPEKSGKGRVVVALPSHSSTMS
jgi:hypothetical protein